jgi:hypothetical protein
MYKHNPWPETQAAIKNVGPALAKHWREGRPVFFNGPGSFQHAAVQLNIKLMSAPVERRV